MRITLRLCGCPYIYIYRRPARLFRWGGCRSTTQLFYPAKGRTIGRTIALLNRPRIGRILGDNRSTRWLDLFPSAPLLISTLLKQTNDHGLCPCVFDGSSQSTRFMPCHAKSRLLKDHRVTDVHLGWLPWTTNALPGGFDEQRFQKGGLKGSLVVVGRWSLSLPPRLHRMRILLL